MSKRPFEKIVIRGQYGDRPLTLDEYRSIPLKERCLFLVQGRIRFLTSRGEEIPAKTALRYLADQSAEPRE